MEHKRLRVLNGTPSGVPHKGRWIGGRWKVGRCHWHQRQGIGGRDPGDLCGRCVAQGHQSSGGILELGVPET